MKNPHTNNISIFLIFFHKIIEISNDLIDGVSKLLTDKELADNIYLLEDSDIEIEPYSPSNPSSKTSRQQPKVTSTSHQDSSESDSDTDSSDTDSDSDSSSSSGTDSSDDEEEEDDTKENTKQEKAKQNAINNNVNSNNTDDDDDIIILDHDDFKDDIKPPEETTIHVNCYVSRDILAKDDHLINTRMAILIMKGDSTSYLQSTFYTDLTTKARQTIMESHLIDTLRKDGVSIQLHLPKIHYTAMDGTNTKVPLPLNPTHMANMSAPKAIYTLGHWHTGFSIYFTMTMDYHYVIERELRRRQHRHQEHINSTQQPNKQSQMERLLVNTPILTYPNLTNLNISAPKTSQSQPTANTKDVTKEGIRIATTALNPVATPNRKRPQQHLDNLMGPPCKASRIEPPTQRTNTDFNTRTKKEVTHIIHRTHKTMTTLHKRKPIFDRLGPTNRHNINQPIRHRQQQQMRNNLRRNWRRRQAILDINNN